MRNKEAIILAGGKGTRLSKVVSDVPKPMAMVSGRPFLCHLLHKLKREGFTKVIIADGYLRECIEGYFGSEYDGLLIEYSSESTPLGTGGAIRKALNYCQNEWVYVFNGDTYFDANLKQIDLKLHKIKDNIDAVLCATKVENCERFGTIKISSDNSILSFKEKSGSKYSVISAGIYILKKKSFMNFRVSEFSIEKDYFEKIAGTGRMIAVVLDGTFIDIGTPEDYNLAQQLLS